MMFCPKCSGGGFLVDEELVKILDERSAARELRAILKATYVCRACSERFSRLHVDDLSKRKKPVEQAAPIVATPTQEPPSTGAPEEGLRFF